MEKVYKQIVDFIRETFHKPSGFIALHEPVFNGNEKKYLNECIGSTFVSSVGKFVDEFEIEMAKYTGAKKTIVCVKLTSRRSVNDRSHVWTIVHTPAGC